MTYEPIFKEGIDIGRVEPHLSINLTDAINNGEIPDTGVACDFNGFEDCDSIGSRVCDPIGAVDLQKFALTSAAQSITSAKAAEAAAAAAQTTVNDS